MEFLSGAETTKVNIIEASYLSPQTVLSAGPDFQTATPWIENARALIESATLGLVTPHYNEVREANRNAVRCSHGRLATDAHDVS
ncbi:MULTISPECIES: hypothetical protein [unclassified Rhizobium]|uniref:hypothetical protein n=1 Tax=unclassified Rhizobium TaxID=2613769 RepID=UPI0006FD9D0A|nr:MULTISPECIES: hypothetical protein [unclassified Rhizobium]KQV44123.1 hypothetical protein ASC86_04925 [Rhizobium sp. Root1212]KRD38304.1 hypothetical protein ASE37_04925 [Rhizobium sp. Root268]